MDETDYEKIAERHTKALVESMMESMKQTISEHMTLAWYDPTNHHVSTDKHDPLFTPLGQLWPLVAKQEWVGLTGAEVNHIFAENVGYPERMMKEVEAKLKEKNSG